MIALEKDGNVLYQGSWSRRLQEMLGLRGNAQPALPYTTDSGTLGAAEFVSSDMDAVKTAVAKHVADAYAREAELMEAINSADSVGALRLSPDGKSGIDLTAGWASVPPPDPGE
jgi:hypothetical protein